MKHFIQRLLLTLLLLPAFIYAETITYFIPDAQGSTVAKTNEKGEVIWRAERLPYGQNINLSNKQIDDSPLQYTGAPLDSYSGLTYLKARYYNADIGRFYAVDPVWFTADNVQMFNRYAYANNSPYRYVDPDGKFPWAIPVVIGLYFGTADTAQAPTYEGDIKSPSLGDRAIIAGATGAATAAVIAMGPKEVAQTTFEETTGVEIPMFSAKKIAKEVQSIVKISPQKQASHIKGTAQYKNRIKQGKDTSTFFGKKSGEKLTRIAHEKGTPVPNRNNVKEYDFGISVGVSPRGKMQTKVRVHEDEKGRIHGHPVGRERD